MVRTGGFLLAFAAGAASAAPPTAPAPPTPVVAATASPDEADEAAQLAALEHAFATIQSGHAEAALAPIDAVIAHYEARYPPGKTRWYVARDLPETLAYLAMATMSPPIAKSGETKAQALSVQWANAWYLKGYTLVELKRLDEARVALQRAIALSPYNATYLTELAEVGKLQRDWPATYDLFAQAEAAAEFSPDDEKAHDKGKAMRGRAFVFVEQGKLDEARNVLEACLKLDRNDARARQDLEYIRKLEHDQRD